MVRLGESSPCAGRGAAHRSRPSTAGWWTVRSGGRRSSRTRSAPGDVSIVPLRLGLREDVGVIVAASARDRVSLRDRQRLAERRSEPGGDRAAGGTAPRGAEAHREGARCAGRGADEGARRRQRGAAAHHGRDSAGDHRPRAGRKRRVRERLRARLHGAEPRRRRGRRPLVARIFHPDDLERVRREREVGLARGAPFESELRARRKDGQYRWFLVRYHPLRSRSGEILRWYATGIDIEDRRRTEERVRNENLALRDEIDRSSMFEEIVGSSEGLRRVLAQVAKVAPTDSTVLIVGRDGNGQGARRARHPQAVRAREPRVHPGQLRGDPVRRSSRPSCSVTRRAPSPARCSDGSAASRPPTAGRSSWTRSATCSRRRRSRYCGSCRRGSSSASAAAAPSRVDVRVLAATHRDLGAAVKAGTFREDLFYRLNVFPIEIPPLRDRRDDVLLLVRYMHRALREEGGEEDSSASTRDTLELFRAYGWPGNVRELQNVVERAVILSDGEAFVVDLVVVPAAGEPGLHAGRVPHRRARRQRAGAHRGGAGSVQGPRVGPRRSRREAGHSAADPGFEDPRPAHRQVQVQRFLRTRSWGLLPPSMHGVRSGRGQAP